VVPGAARAPGGEPAPTARAGGAACARPLSRGPAARAARAPARARRAAPTLARGAPLLRVRRRHGVREPREPGATAAGDPRRPALGGRALAPAARLPGAADRLLPHPRGGYAARAR